MVQQIEIILKPKRRGFHLVTSEILSQLPKLPKMSNKKLLRILPCQIFHLP